MRLPRKQMSNHQDWIAARRAILLDPGTPARARALISEAAARVRARAGQATRPVVAWSGGKDSLALKVVTDEAGVEDSMLVISGLEYPAFLAWVASAMPWRLHVELRAGINLAWLKANPHMLFPADAATAAKWFAQVQHAGQRSYAAATGTDLLIMGRRTADGNHCGRRTPLGHEYADKTGFARYSPIAGWSHEDVLCVLSYAGIDLPPCYSWPRGFRVGTGPWPARQWTDGNGWAEIAQIDPAVVELAAAAGIPGADSCAG